VKFPRFHRSLRFRLTLSYVFFFTSLLAVAGIFFREVLAATLANHATAVLEEEWAAVKGYLRFEKRRPVWFFDPVDPEEAYIVERLKRIYLLTDPEGRVLEVSASYRALGLESPDEIARILKSQKPNWTVRNNLMGRPFMIRSGAVIDGRGEYFLAIGRSLSDDHQVVHDFTRDYFMLLPLPIAVSSLFGWFMAGRALRPVNHVARTAQRISSSSLKVQIPLRNAGDELDHLIESFNRMIERLSSSFEQIRQFSTDVSHELRTPLTAIRGQLEVALFTAKNPEQYREAMLNALEDVERLSAIVRALLLLSQAESGQLTLQKAQLDVSALVRDIVDQFQIPAEAGKVRLRADLPEELPALLDRVQMERLISNLLSNAIKYTPPGGAVTVRVLPENGVVRLEVEDTGQGIPAEHLPHIFDRFYRVPDRNPEKGLGLGLSFVSWIVKAHGGSIDVQSEPGKGSRFSVSLPAGPVSEAVPVA
jgi:heavy metal sensor kinase